ncbi:hypothetical protein SLS60_005070 [Paraconiothyrium brasiliense]|uniref:Ankyrin repeat protein n=1 Tax=Paraconiothyrium brasiliense TaxID=300254 RepID=A0ABR3RGR3_9PLEO
MDVVKDWRRRREQHESDWRQHETSPRQHETWHTGPGSNLIPDSSQCRIYCERTLDEAYYPSLPNDQLEDRNRTQVVQRQYMKENNCEQSEWPILLVPQLWIWKMDDVIVSTYPLHTNQMKYRDNEDYTRKVTRQADVDCHMTKAIWEHVDAFRRPFRDADSGKVIFASALDIFELAVVETLSDVRQYAAERSIQSIDMELERKLIESLADIRSELDMISTVMAQQEEIIDNVINDRTERAAASRKTQVEEIQYAISNGQPEKADESHRAALREHDLKTNACMGGLRTTKGCIENYKRRIAKINRDADKVAKTVDDMLILSRTEASIKEAQNNVIIGWAAIAFAIVTVIFKPSSFMTSLMALPIKQFIDRQYKYDDSNRAYNSGYLASIFIGAEIASLLVTGTILGSVYWFSSMNRRSGKKPGTDRRINTQANDTPREAKKQDPPDTEVSTSNSTEQMAKSTRWFAGHLPDSLTRRLRSKKKDEEIGGQEKQKSEV